MKSSSLDTQPHLFDKHFASSQCDEVVDEHNKFYGYDGSLVIEPFNSRGPFGYEFSAILLGGIALTSMDWTYGFRATIGKLHECFDFCASTHGSYQATIGKQVVTAGQEEGFILSPKHPVKIIAEDQIRFLNITIPKKLIAEQLHTITGRELENPLEFDPAISLATQPQSGVWPFVRWLRMEIERDHSCLLNPIVSQQFSEVVLTSLLYAQPHNYSGRLHLEVTAAEPFYIRRVEEYLEANCQRAISSRELTDITGVSMSAIYAGFRRHRNYTPFGFLQDMRLRRVRNVLLTAQPGIQIGVIAKQMGFTHMGRFSQVYKRRFKETPSDTLRRS